MPLFLLALLAGAGGPAVAPPHPFSVSFLDLEAGPGGLTVTYRPQARTLLESERLGLDRDRDGLLARDELRAAWPAVRAYLEAGLRLEADGVRLKIRFGDPVFEALPDFLGGSESPFFARLSVTARIPWKELPRRILVETRLFFDDGNPGHRTRVAATGLRGGPWEVWLGPEQPGTLLPPPPDARHTAGRGAGVVTLYLRIGFEHVLGGIDHLGFVLALLLGVSGWRSLLGAVTAFTLAHSLTLALSALGVFGLPPAVVEPGIAASVLAVAWLHRLLGPGRAHPARAAFPFGLLHGFGFAGVLGEIGLPPGARVEGLLGFNLGVEAGQLAFVLPVAGAAALLFPRLDAEARQALRSVAAVAVAALGLHLTAASASRFLLPPLAARLPAALAPLPAGLLLLVLCWLGLRGRHSPGGEPLGPQVGLCGALWLLYLAGTWLGGI